MNFRLDYRVTKRKTTKEKRSGNGLRDRTTEEEIISISGKKIVVTGAIPNMARRQVQLKIENNGGIFQTAVGTSTDYLIVGNTKGNITTKMQTAARLRVPLVSYKSIQEFRR